MDRRNFLGNSVVAGFLGLFSFNVFSKEKELKIGDKVKILRNENLRNFKDEIGILDSIDTITIEARGMKNATVIKYTVELLNKKDISRRRIKDYFMKNNLELV